MCSGGRGSLGVGWRFLDEVGGRFFKILLFDKVRFLVLVRRVLLF